MSLMGIDQSLTGTGIVIIGYDGKVQYQLAIKNQPELPTIRRVLTIVEKINSILQEYTPDLIMVEGFSFGSKGQSLFEIAYLGWRIREELEYICPRIGANWMEPTPSMVKKFCTGNGNAAKQIIIKEVYKRWGFDTNDDDIADAFVLAQIARAYKGVVSNLTVFQHEVIGVLRGEKPAKKAKTKKGQVK